MAKSSHRVTASSLLPELDARLLDIRVGDGVANSRPTESVEVVKKLRVKDGVYYIGDDMLIVRYREGDIDICKPSHGDEMLVRALYDIRQTSDVLDDGDRIARPNGRYVAYVDGVHVVAWED